MRMQEPEQWQAPEQQWQTNQEYGEYRAEDPGWGETEQQQKIYPQEERKQQGLFLAILGIILSAFGFLLSIAGIVVSSLLLKYAHGQQAWVTGGAIGLIASILILLVCVAIFVIAVISLALRARRTRRWHSRWSVSP